MKKILNGKKKKGFTLIELLVVMGIIGVLSLVTAPTIMSKVDEAKEKADVSNASSIAMAVKSEMAEGESFPKDLTEANLTALADEYFDGKIPAPQTENGKKFDVTVEGSKVTVKVGDREIYPEYTEVE